MGTIKNGMTCGLVIVPAYNEDRNLPAVLSNIRDCLPEFDIVVVDDGSHDRTAEVASENGVNVVSHCVNIGYGAAVQTGFKYATLHAYRIIVLMDADGQHDAADAPALVTHLTEQNADMVVGSRFLSEKTYKTTFCRVVVRNFFCMVTYLLTHRRFIDISSGFKVFNRKAVAFLSENYPVDFPDAEVIILMLLSGYKVIEAPANFRTRVYGTSMFSLARKIYYPFRSLLGIVAVLLQVVVKKERSRCH